MSGTDPFQRKIQKAARVASKEVARLVSVAGNEPRFVKLWLLGATRYDGSRDNGYGLLRAEGMLSIPSEMRRWVESELALNPQARRSHRRCIESLTMLEFAIDNLATHLKRKKTIGRLGRSHT